MFSDKVKRYKLRKVLILMFMIVALIIATAYLIRDSLYIKQGKLGTNINNSIIKSIVSKIPYRGMDIETVVIHSDKDKDGIYDLEDIVEGAFKDAANKPKYKSAYYNGGYPPENEGVCTDVVWRALKNAGYNLKDMVDKDIKEYTDEYPRVEGKPDPNIDFRRVRNLYVFFEKYGEKLTMELKPGDTENLQQWQPGDIVLFQYPKEHIVIVSDKRMLNGVPYIIHNSGPYTKENNDLQYWMDEIIGHYRFPKSN